MTDTLNPRTRMLLEAPIAPTLLRLAAPNVLVMLAQAGVGLAIGSGLLVPAAITIVFMLVALILFERFERRFFPSEQIKTISLCFGGASIDTQEIRGITERYGIRVRTINVIQEIIRNRVQVDLLVTFPSTIDIPKFYEDLRLLPNIYKIKMDEKF